MIIQWAKIPYGAKHRFPKKRQRSMAAEFAERPTPKDDNNFITGEKNGREINSAQGDDKGGWFERNFQL